MAETVRLVVWDLDDTFWKGTVTEGGITEYLQAHHDIVVTLAKRGILSSICSKNDAATIHALLKEYGISDYFIFPSISWEPKGVRLQQLIEDVQLRAPTVMFIDDNPLNRAEAKAFIPEIQVEDETFIAQMLDDPRFKGKDDSDLSRLKQYKLLEKRKVDHTTAVGSNEDFLRSCDVKVYLEMDIETHVDRVVELINRTNQLNYTKRRLPEDIEQARKSILEDCNRPNCHAALVKVVDKYGDYGYVGFYQYRAVSMEFKGRVQTHLVDFCFSCRTLGMYVEQWVYNYLGRPHLHAHAVGEVLTDLSIDRNIDWIHHVSSLENREQSFEKVARNIYIHSGCEGQSIGVYLPAYCDKVSVYGSYVASGLHVRGNTLRLLQFDRLTPQFAEEIATLGLPRELEVYDHFQTAGAGDVFVLSFAPGTFQDCNMKHRRFGWELSIAVDGMGGAHAHLVSDEQIEQMISGKGQYFSPDRRATLLRNIAHIRANYDTTRPLAEGDARREFRDFLLSNIPAGVKVIVLVPSERTREPNLRSLVLKYINIVMEATAGLPWVQVISSSSGLLGDDDIIEGFHYSRRTYQRLAQCIADCISAMPPRQLVAAESDTPEPVADPV